MNLTRRYNEDIKDIGNHEEIYKNKFILWQRKIKCSTKYRPKYAIDAFFVCNKDIFPNIIKLLQILATLPVSSAAIFFYSREN